MNTPSHLALLCAAVVLALLPRFTSPEAGALFVVVVMGGTVKNARGIRPSSWRVKHIGTCAAGPQHKRKYHP